MDLCGFCSVLDRLHGSMSVVRGATGIFVSPELSSVRDYVITHSVRSMYVVCVCMYMVICKIDHCIHIHWCIVVGLGHNDPWVESHMWRQQRSCRGQWPLVQVFGKKDQCIHILWCIFKSNITMIAKVCARENMRDSWFENRLVFWGAKSFCLIIFPGVKCFFPIENFHFSRPRTNFRHFQKWKEKKKKKKVLTFFYTFSYFHFQFSTFPFTIFLLFFWSFHPFPFFPCLFFPIRQQKFPGQKSLGGGGQGALCPPPVTPLSVVGMLQF